MKEIELTQGKVALVDDEDFCIVSSYTWYVIRSENSIYAIGRKKGSGKTVQAQMHRLVTGANKGMEVDHIDGNGLNNQKQNLRVCTKAENQWNRGKTKRNTTGYKGVFRYESKTNPFGSTIKVNKKNVYLGLFPTAEDAARAYDEAAKKYHGIFARLNFRK